MTSVYRSRAMLAVLLLGFSSGLPLMLVGKTLQAWMTAAGCDLTVIGLAGLVSLPYSIKVFWSPLLERWGHAGLGYRRTWMLATQLGLMLALFAMSRWDPGQPLIVIVAMALVVATLSATQDIAIDAWRIDALEPRELGAGASTAILGYRCAVLASFAGALRLTESLSWNQVYVLMAVGQGVGLLGTFLAGCRREPPPAVTSLDQSLRIGLVEFVVRLRWRFAALIAFAVLYKYGDALAGAMATPFLIKHGYALKDIGDLQGVLGLGATILGTLLGGWAFARWSMAGCLWVFGVLQAVSNLGYAGLAMIPASYAALATAVTIENLAAGLGTAAFVGFLMSQCDRRCSAVQYALLSGLMALGRDVLSASSGYLAGQLGWPWFFTATAVLAIPGLLLIPWAVGTPPARTTTLPPVHP
jgi:PAT family beta-lactamase induction signal transducer AmpG